MFVPVHFIYAHLVGCPFQLRKLPPAYASIERRRSNTAMEQSEFIYFFLKTRNLLEPHAKLYNFINKEFYDLSWEIAKVRDTLVEICLQMRA